MSKNRDVNEIVKRNLCTGCGTCVAMCPENALQMVINRERAIYFPRTVEKKCSRCGTCLRLCPGQGIQNQRLEQEIFGRKSNDSLLGNCQKYYAGHSTDVDTRFNSASGGLVTALLLFALEEGIIDGALVTKMSENNPLLPQPFIARTKEEIFAASGSKYCPVPTNVAVREILRKDGRYAFVGLPCHINGIRNAESANETLRKRIVLHLGLLCSVGRSFSATEYLLFRLGIKKEDVSELKYRGRHGWIGGMSVIKKDGTETFVPYPTYWTRIWRSYFIPMRCTLCDDQTAELADASFGDIWLPEFNGDQIGTSMCIARSEISLNILQKMIAKSKLQLSEITRDKIISSQQFGLTNKKEYLEARYLFFKRLGRPTPTYVHNFPSPKVEAYLRACSLYFQIFLSSKQYFWNLLTPFAALLESMGSLERKSHSD